jgi:hypothetical protein
MITKAICPESGREYLGLTKTEVDAIGDIVFTAVKQNPRQPDTRPSPMHCPPVASGMFLINACGLVDDDDFTRGELQSLISKAQKAGIGVPPVLLTPGTTYEKFRGAWGDDEYQWLRRFKYARWLIACAKKHGIDLAHEYGWLPCTQFVSAEQGKYGPVAVDWFRIAAEPQIAEMAIVLEKNREAEKNKRSGSRAGNRAKQLRAAGYQRRGFKWALDIDVEEEPS